MKFTLFTANCIGDKENTDYPRLREIASPSDMDEAIIFDHVCAKYKGDRRSSEGFVWSDVLVLDCDNDHSENSADWISPEKMNELLPNISYVLVPSRNDGKEKGGCSARPRFHAYFMVDRIESSKKYAEMKRRVQQTFRFFDSNALDSARFIFGSDRGGCFWHEGLQTIDKVLENSLPTGGPAVPVSIPEGSRNNTLSRFAAKVLKRYGDTDKAFELFLNEADKCESPLAESELKAIWNSAIKLWNRIRVQKGYISPEEYNSEFRKESLKPDDYSDIGQAKVFAKTYGEELRYSEGTDYIRFDGEVWNESRQQSVGAIEEFLDLQLQDALDGIEDSLNRLETLGVERADAVAGGKKLMARLSSEQEKGMARFLSEKKYHEFVMQRRNMKYITSALQAAKPMLEVKMSELDRDGFLLNTPGTTYDLRLGMAGGRTPDPLDLITKQTAVTPSDRGRELWEESLRLFFCEDMDLIGYVQQIVGLAAIGKVYVEALIIAYGEGSNGKSTFWNTISRVLGSFSGSMSADALTVGCKRNVKPEMAELKGKRLIIAAELEEGMRLNTSIIKQLCSTDEISAEKKYKDPFRFTPSHTLVLYTNHLPKVGANDAGTWRRLIVIPFNAKIRGGSDIKNYSDHLFDNAGPAVLEWIIEGSRKVIERDFHLEYPVCVKNAIEAYRENNDWLGSFLGECCEIGPSLTQKSGDLYQEYRAFCARNGEYTRGTADFYSALENTGFERRKTKSGNYVCGLVLKEETSVN